jgi:hypothetical protein
MPPKKRHIRIRKNAANGRNNSAKQHPRGVQKTIQEIIWPICI